MQFTGDGIHEPRQRHGKAAEFQLVNASRMTFILYISESNRIIAPGDAVSPATIFLGDFVSSWCTRGRGSATVITCGSTVPSGNSSRPFSKG
jgi:hypothetical protein